MQISATQDASRYGLLYSSFCYVGPLTSYCGVIVSGFFERIGLSRKCRIGADLVVVWRHTEQRDIILKSLFYATAMPVLCRKISERQ